jgi:hypothetical protein
MGFDYRSHLLFHSGPRRWAWAHWSGGGHTVFGLRFIPSSGIIPDPYFLRLVTAEEKLLTVSDS